MKPIKNSYQLMSRVSDGFVPLMITAIILPFGVLAVFGVISLFENGYWLLFLMITAALCIAIFLPYLWLRRKHKIERSTAEEFAEIMVEPSLQWADFDRQVWQSLNILIDQQLAEAADWPSLRSHAFTVVSEAASQYHPESNAKELAFSAPEFLLMVEEVSRRYRHLLHDHIPFSEKIRITTLKQGYEQKGKIQTAKKAYDIYRVFRAVTPAGWIAEARGQIIGRLFDEVSAEVQAKLKKTLLQEVASVAIDLYSGRFKAKDAELQHSHAADLDEERLAPDIEPLRVAVIGQVSAGKSSVINAIAGSIVAEVSTLPSTDRVTVHKCEVEGIELVHLVDLPGMDGNPKTESLIFEQIVNSDLVFWVLKANQPARALDSQLKIKVDAFYADTANRSRKKPQIMALVNQVDRLQPIQEWAPPYDFTSGNTPKAMIIKEAVEYNQALLNPDKILPLCVGEGKTAYNLDQINTFLQAAYQSGVNTQLNRRRLEHDKLALGEQARRLYRLGKKMFELSGRD
ncbi:GTPase family protein [Photobacterium lipolyticum]|uniref:GTPase n=1 Tax=Photobacterium lipolyticum TaxID=266810 RepID=A0A2T3MV04_9GAMM|nr:dynamin family protein [Photobacterium lipolyticum]PSW03781.1 GTPase [Photobacterium lipolyticum]